VGVLLVALAVLAVAGNRLAAAVPAFAEWVHGLGAWGPAAYVVGYALAVVAFVPGAILTLAGGAVFGLVLGTLYVLVAATLGASLAFLVSRYAVRPWIERRVAGDARFAAIDRAVGLQGRRIVFLLRLSPVFPFTLLNYALGATRVRFADYLIASIGMLPGTILYVYYGKLAGEVAQVASGAPHRKGPGDWVVLGLGLVATLVVTTLVTRLARRALREATDAEPGEGPP
jgi:uncharacterized membrane protein YdjX (TVP38/TMEM64 family)